MIIELHKNLKFTIIMNEITSNHVKAMTEKSSSWTPVVRGRKCRRLQAFSPMGRVKFTSRADIGTARDLRKDIPAGMAVISMKSVQIICA